MAVKLYRCSNLWVKFGGHPCWRVQKALDEAGVEYEIVKGPYRKGKRDRARAAQRPAAVPRDRASRTATAYREQSKDMAARIAAGKLMEADRPAAAGSSPRAAES